MINAGSKQANDGNGKQNGAQPAEAQPGRGLSTSTAVSLEAIRDYGLANGRESTPPSVPTSRTECQTDASGWYGAAPDKTWPRRR